MSLDIGNALQMLGMIVGGVVYVEARLRNQAEQISKSREAIAQAREDFRDQVSSAIRQRDASIAELRAMVEARVAQEAQARAEVARDLAEHKLAMVRELREYPTVTHFERTLEQAIDPLRAEVHRMAGLFQAALESGRLVR